MKYYRHKDKHNVICEMCKLFGGYARFGKWVWKNNVCSEEYTYKDVTEDFKKSFEEITQKQFNDVWGVKLQNA